MGQQRINFFIRFLCFTYRCYIKCQSKDKNDVLIYEMISLTLMNTGNLCKLVTEVFVTNEAKTEGAC